MASKNGVICRWGLAYFNLDEPSLPRYNKCENVGRKLILCNALFLRKVVSPGFMPGLYHEVSTRFFIFSMVKEKE